MGKAYIFVLLALALLIAGCTQPQAGQQGRVVFTIADKAADMGQVSSIKVTVDSVMVQNSASGWVTVTSTPKTYDLLRLRATGGQALMADINLSNGNYNQIRLQISKVVVTDGTGNHEARLPSGDLKIVGGFDVNGNSTSAVLLDFAADQSLHVTGNGDYMLAPVVHLQTKENAAVDANDATDVKVEGGAIKTDVQVGMDENGTVGEGVRIPANVTISIDNNGIVKIVGTNETGKGRVVFGITDKPANLSSVTSVDVTVDSIMVQSAGGDWVTVESAPKTYDLLQLSGRTALAADANLSSGTYNQVRLQISEVVVTDAAGSHNATLPSGDLRIVARISVETNSTSTVLFDFLANESLHITGDGKYMMAPVVKVEARSGADVGMKANNEIEISSGNLDTSIKVGMDENGTVGVGARIPADVNISISNNGIVKIVHIGN